MSYTKTELNRMSRDDLATLALQECGEFFDADATKKDILDVVLPKLVEADAPKQPEAAPQADPGEERCWLMLTLDNMNGNSNGDQFLGVNQYEVQIRYGRWANVKKMLVTMLDNLIITKHEPYVDEQGKMKTRTSDVPRFSYLTRTLEQGPGADLKRSGNLTGHAQ